ncbi:MAG: ATP-dependent helicase HrpB, partial [Alphaproteobacteria bacterium]|nr:ATP-dependent helicase HrpB [Alphaproteobacteria bacterium]
LTSLPRRDTLNAVPLAAALEALLPWPLQQELEAEAPARVEVPSGSRIRLDYDGEAPPILAVRLQEMFGLAETPRVAWGRVPVLVHLLSPAGRPVQVTRDLASFWATGYAAVKADLKGRYPKHAWPDDPLQATPTSRTRRRSA